MRPYANLAYQISGFKVSHFASELNATAIFLMGDAVKAPEKIQMPKFAIVFAIGNVMESSLLLLFYQFANGILLNSLVLKFSNLAGLQISLGVLQICGAQKTAHHIKMVRI